YYPAINRLRLQVLHGPDGTKGKEALLPLEGTPEGWVFAKRQTLVLDRIDTERLAGWDIQHLLRAGVKAGCWLPLMSRGRVLGTLCAASTHEVTAAELVGYQGRSLLIHRLSPRRDHTFVRLNCAAIPSGLLESELFGHEKGAFTGAIMQKIGRLELAHLGSLFLDEVGDIPLELQPKLLRAFQEKEFER